MFEGSFVIGWASRAEPTRCAILLLGGGRDLAQLYPFGLENRHELDENPDPEPEPLPARCYRWAARSPGKGFWVWVCLSLEALSNMRIFRPLPVRKNSGQSSDRCDNLSDEEFLFIFESFVTRAENAVDATVNAFQRQVCRCSHLLG